MYIVYTAYGSMVVIIQTDKAVLKLRNYYNKQLGL